MQKFGEVRPETQLLPTFEEGGHRAYFNASLSKTCLGAVKELFPSLCCTGNLVLGALGNWLSVIVVSLVVFVSA